MGTPPSSLASVPPMSSAAMQMTQLIGEEYEKSRFPRIEEWTIDGLFHEQNLKFELHAVGLLTFRQPAWTTYSPRSPEPSPTASSSISALALEERTRTAPSPRAPTTFCASSAAKVITGPAFGAGSPPAAGSSPPPPPLSGAAKHDGGPCERAARRFRLPWRREMAGDCPAGGWPIA
jgi:hypothetical protein